MNDKTITRTTSRVKYLEVFIDGTLTWSNVHIAYLENKLSRSVKIFLKYLTDSALKSLYFRFVYSHLQFVIGAWSGVGIQP